jgi:hypothetical protein
LRLTGVSLHTMLLSEVIPNSLGLPMGDCEQDLRRLPPSESGLQILRRPKGWAKPRGARAASMDLIKANPLIQGDRLRVVLLTAAEGNTLVG